MSTPPGGVSRALAALAAVLSPASAFVVIALLAGVTLAIVSPPLRWGDENTHFLQSYALSEGHTRPVVVKGVLGVEVPRAVFRFIIVLTTFHGRREPGVPSWDDVMGTREIRTDGERAFAPLAVYTYSMIGYVPQALGIALARLFTDSILLQFYAARVANLLCWTLLVWLALRTTPYLRLVLGVAALGPMTVFLAASCSADGVTNGLAFLWTAYVIRLAAGDDTRAPAPSEWIALGLLAIAFALTKLLYTPLLLLLLILPPARLGGTRRLLGVSAAVLALGVIGVATFVLLSWDELLKTINYRGDAAAAANLALLREHPATVLAIIATTTWNFSGRWLWQLADTNWQGIAPPNWLFWVWFAALLAAFLAERRPAGWPTPRQRLVALLAPVLAWIAIALGAFLFWTKGQNAVAGLQGRYWIPLLPSLLLALSPPSLPLGARLSMAARGAALALSVWVLLHTIQRSLLMY